MFKQNPLDLLPLNPLEKRIFKKAIYIWLFLLLESLFSRHLTATGGVFVGGLASMFSFYHLVATVDTVCDDASKNAAKLLAYTKKKFAFRSFLMLGILGVSWIGGRYFFGGAVLGYLVVKLAVIADVIIELMRNYFKNYLSKMKRR